LFYVAISRAQQQLHLTWARARRKGERLESREPSPWLQLIETANQRPTRPSTEQASRHLAEARKSLGAVDSETTLRYRRLRDWIDRTARSRRIQSAALLPDHLIARVAEQAPTTISQLEMATGLGRSRLERIGPEILAVIAER
jgi:DNA helicase-2/ATP-dependent DNA helicase PcrA